MKIAVLLHLYHEELWPELRAMLADLPPHDLFITATAPRYSPVIYQSLRDSGATISHMENKGRDVLPFLRKYQEIQGDYDAFLKIHTKVSPHQQSFGRCWQLSLCTTLLGGAEECLRLLENPTVGMVTDGHFLLPWQGRGRNALMVAALCRQMGYDRPRATFPAGTMFWVRRGVLDAMAEMALSLQWEEEVLAKDGATPHALERMFGIAVANQDLRLVGLKTRQASAICTAWERAHGKSILRKLSWG